VKLNLLNEIKDLVLTVKNGNIQNEKVYSLWIKKLQNVEEHISKLTPEDMRKLNTEYMEWFNSLNVSHEHKKLLEDLKFSNFDG
jgi:hypothetical protein